MSGMNTPSLDSRRRRYLLLALMVAEVWATAASGVTVKGEVVDAQTGTPLRSMIVAAYSVAGSRRASATTDSAGRYSLDLPPAEYRLLAYDENGIYATTFAGDAESFDTSSILTVSAEISGYDFALRRAGSVQGTVFDLATSSPIFGATVAAYNISGTRRGFTQADASGAYSLVLPPGLYRIAAYDDAGLYSPRFYLDQNTFDAATNVRVGAGQTTNGVHFHLDRAARFHGRVTDFDTGHPLPDMTVVGYTEDGVALEMTTTDANGNFILRVPPGSYKLAATDPRMIFATGFLDDANSFAAVSIMSVGPGEDRQNVNLTLHRAGTIVGAVSDASARVLPRMSVAAYNDDGSQRTTVHSDINGGYVLALPPGTFRIAAYDESLVYAHQFYDRQVTFTAAAPVVVTSGQTIDRVDFSLDRGARVSGVISDGGDGTVTQGITVAAFDADGNTLGTAVTSANGTYSFVLPAGGYKFVAYDDALRYATAYADHAATYEETPMTAVSADSPVTLDFTMTAGIRLAGTVVDGRRAPVDGVRIAALDAEGRHVATTTARNGTFYLTLLPDTYKLQMTDPQGRYYDLYFNSASSLATAENVVIEAAKTREAIAFIVIAKQRRRAVDR
jgi:hypothetical protein